MKIGVITNGLSNDFEEACRIMCETGVRYAEIQHHNGIRIEYNPIEEAYKIRDSAAKYNIIPVCVTTHAFVGIPVSAIEVGDPKYEEQMGLLKNGIRVAKILNVPLVRSMCFSKQIVTFGSHGAGNWMTGGNKAWAKLLELYKPIIELAEQEEIDLVVENGANGMISSTVLFRKLYEDTGKSPRLKFLWDPANALCYGEKPTPEVYESIRDICAHIHIKDMTVDPVKSTVDIRNIGRGDMAPYLQDLAQVLRKENYQGCVSLENIYQPEGKDYVDGYRLDIVELKKIFGDEIA